MFPLFAYVVNPTPAYVLHFGIAMTAALVAARFFRDRRWVVTIALATTTSASWLWKEIDFSHRIVWQELVYGPMSSLIPVFPEFWQLDAPDEVFGFIIGWVTPALLAYVIALQWTPASKAVAARRRQFSLMSVLLVITAVAIVCGLYRVVGNALWLPLLFVAAISLLLRPMRLYRILRQYNRKRQKLRNRRTAVLNRYSARSHD